MTDDTFRHDHVDVGAERIHVIEAGDPTGLLLYLRGEEERSGHIDSYVEGLHSAGLTHVEPALVPGTGHFTPEEAPEATWDLIRRFIPPRSWCAPTTGTPARCETRRGAATSRSTAAASAPCDGHG